MKNAIALCIHVVRSHNEIYWIFIILMLQPLGGIIYFAGSWSCHSFFEGGTRRGASRRRPRRSVGPQPLLPHAAKQDL